MVKSLKRINYAQDYPWEEYLGLLLFLLYSNGIGNDLTVEISFLRMTGCLRMLLWTLFAEELPVGYDYLMKGQI